MTEDEYFKLLERIVKGAEYLENPLITKEDYAKGMRLYDGLCEKARAYRTHHSSDGERTQPKPEGRTTPNHPGNAA